MFRSICLFKNITNVVVLQLREVFSETISWHQKRLTFILHAIIQDSWRSCNEARKPCEKVLVGGTEEGKTEHFSSGMGMIA